MSVCVCVCVCVCVYIEARMCMCVPACGLHGNTPRFSIFLIMLRRRAYLHGTPHVQTYYPYIHTNETPTIGFSFLLFLLFSGGGRGGEVVCRPHKGAPCHRLLGYARVSIQLGYPCCRPLHSPVPYLSTTTSSSSPLFSLLLLPPPHPTVTGALSFLP